MTQDDFCVRLASATNAFDKLVLGATTAGRLEAVHIMTIEVRASSLAKQIHSTERELGDGARTLGHSERESVVGDVDCATIF